MRTSLNFLSWFFKKKNYQFLKHSFQFIQVFPVIQKIILISRQKIIIIIKEARVERKLRDVLTEPLTQCKGRLDKPPTDDQVKA